MPPDERIELLDELIACREPPQKQAPPKRHIIPMPNTELALMTLLSSARARQPRVSGRGAKPKAKAKANAVAQDVAMHPVEVDARVGCMVENLPALNQQRTMVSTFSNMADRHAPERTLILSLFDWGKVWGQFPEM